MDDITSHAVDGRWSRRRMLQAATLGAVAHSLEGCVRPFTPICPNDPIWTAPGAASTIDIHSHFFNARDLPVARFIELTGQDAAGGFGDLVKAVGKLLQGLGWSLAPGAKSEHQELDRIAGAIKACDGRNLDHSVTGARDAQYTVARNELQRAAGDLQFQRGVNPDQLRSAEFAELSAEDRALKSIDRLPGSYEQFIEQTSGSDAEALKVTLGSGLHFVVEMFQYRYVSFLSYLEAYSRRPERRIDLACSALVDYDWWLDKGDPTKTTLPTQIKLMQRLAIVTGGRMHAWAPFCPFREVMSREGADTFSSLAFVKDAVENRGAIGVKLYPPMGFRAYGNADLPHDFWRGAPWLPARAGKDDFGGKLDGALHDLYLWCRQEEVPILAHSASSNGPAKKFRDCALAPGWKDALDKVRHLRVNFGHFGGGSDADKKEEALAFIALLGGPGEPGDHAYADASFFEEVLDKPEQLKGVLQDLLSASSDPRRLLAQRFLYGTDWKMLTAQAGAEKYLLRFERLVDELAGQTQQDPAPLRSRFFQQSAVDFLGLRKGSKQRDRLDRFYANANVKSPPVWAQAVDG